MADPCDVREGAPTAAALVATLRAKMADLEQQVAATRKELVAALLVASPYREGQIIRLSTGKLVKVIGLDVRPSRNGTLAVFPIAVLQRTDGTWGGEVSPWVQGWNGSKIIQQPQAEG